MSPKLGYPSNRAEIDGRNGMLRAEYRAHVNALHGLESCIETALLTSCYVCRHSDSKVGDDEKQERGLSMATPNGDSVAVRQKVTAAPSVGQNGSSPFAPRLSSFDPLKQHRSALHDSCHDYYVSSTQSRRGGIVEYRWLKCANLLSTEASLRHRGSILRQNKIVTPEVLDSKDADALYQELMPKPASYLHARKKMLYRPFCSWALSREGVEAWRCGWRWTIETLAPEEELSGKDGSTKAAQVVAVFLTACRRW